MIHSDFCPINTSAIPAQWQFEQATNAQLEYSAREWQEQYENACCQDYEDRCDSVLTKIEIETEKRNARYRAV